MRHYGPPLLRKRRLNLASKDTKIWYALSGHLEGYPEKPDGIFYISGETSDLEPDSLHWIVDDLRFNPNRPYWGEESWRVGKMVIHVMVPLFYNKAQLTEACGKVAEYFSSDTQMTFEDVTLTVPYDPTIIMPGYRDGSHTRVPISIPWEGFVE